MWVMAMFDLPTCSRQARRAYTQFRKRLLAAGFVQLQRSVYARHCSSDAMAEHQAFRLQKNLPPSGDVRALLITDPQFSRMRVFVGQAATAVESSPGQLEMF